MFPLHWSQKQDTRCLFCKTRCGCDWTEQYGQEASREGKPTEVIVTYVRLWRSAMKRAKAGVELPRRSAGDAVACEGSPWAVGKVKGSHPPAGKASSWETPADCSSPSLQGMKEGETGGFEMSPSTRASLRSSPGQADRQEGAVPSPPSLWHQMNPSRITPQPPQQKPQARGACDKRGCHVWHIPWHSKARARGTDPAARSPPFLESLQRWQTRAHSWQPRVTALNQR